MCCTPFGRFGKIFFEKMHFFIFTSLHEIYLEIIFIKSKRLRIANIWRIEKYSFVQYEQTTPLYKYDINNNYAYELNCKQIIDRITYVLYMDNLINSLKSCLDYYQIFLFFNISREIIGTLYN